MKQIVTPAANSSHGPRLIIHCADDVSLSLLIPQSDKTWQTIETSAAAVDLPVFRTDFKLQSSLQRLLKLRRKEDYLTLIQDQVPLTAQDLLTWDGLSTLYEAACDMIPRPKNPYAPTDIPQKAAGQTQIENTVITAQPNQCPACLKAVELFLILLARFTRHAILMNGAVGGVYLGGSLVSAIDDQGLFDVRLFKEACYGVTVTDTQNVLKSVPIFLDKSSHTKENDKPSTTQAA